MRREIGHMPPPLQAITCLLYFFDRLRPVIYIANAGYNLPNLALQQVMTCGRIFKMAWNRKLLRARTNLDSRLAPLRPTSQYHPPAKGWIRALRDALGLPADQLGKLMGIRRQSVADMELSEAKGPGERPTAVLRHHVERNGG